MSTIQMEVPYCNCCYIPADQCVVVNDMMQRGVDPAVIELITHEVLCPEVIENVRSA